MINNKTRFKIIIVYLILFKLLIYFIIGLYGEKENADEKKVFVIKDHILKYSQRSLNYDAAIFIIRNPYNALRAYFNFKDTHSHTGYVKEERLLSEGNTTKLKLKRMINRFIIA